MLKSEMLASWLSHCMACSVVEEFEAILVLPRRTGSAGWHAKNGQSAAHVPH